MIVQMQPLSESDTPSQQEGQAGKIELVQVFESSRPRSKARGLSDILIPFLLPCARIFHPNPKNFFLQAGVSTLDKGPALFFVESPGMSATVGHSIGQIRSRNTRSCGCSSVPAYG